jgi:hypothetical protein
MADPATPPAFATALAYQAWTSHDLDQAMTCGADGTPATDRVAGSLALSSTGTFLGGFMAKLTGVQCPVTDKLSQSQRALAIGH